MSKVVVVGGSVGGVRTAQALRSEGHTGDIVLIDEQHEMPYDKPPLSKGLLTGQETGDSIRLLTQREADELGVQLVLGSRAASLDVVTRSVVLSSGDCIAYDHLVIATGSTARTSPWGSATGIHVLRTLSDADALRADLLEGGPVVVIGGGFIGAEVAAAARTLGLEVSIVDPAPTMMSRSMSVDEGTTFAAFHRSHGVSCLLGVGVEAIAGKHRDYLVSLADGREVKAAVVVVGIGATPADEWLRSSGLTIDDGVVCDEYCRAIGVRDVHAVGDVARWHDSGRGGLVRLEHWTNAVDQATVVAHNLVYPDELRRHSPVEYVWSDQHDWKVQIVGRPSSGAEATWVGDPDADQFAVLHQDEGGLLVGAVIVNWPKALILCRRASASGVACNTVREELDSLAPASVTS